MWKYPRLSGSSWRYVGLIWTKLAHGHLVRARPAVSAVRRTETLQLKFNFPILCHKLWAAYHRRHLKKATERLKQKNLFLSLEEAFFKLSERF